jgi:hypothetical protein
MLTFRLIEGMNYKEAHCDSLTIFEKGRNDACIYCDGSKEEEEGSRDCCREAIRGGFWD